MHLDFTVTEGVQGQAQINEWTRVAPHLGKVQRVREGYTSRM